MAPRERGETGGRGVAAEAGEAAGAEREYFLGFPYEPGNYYLAGFEDLDGMEVARIEYYPQELFEDDEDDASDGESERRNDDADGPGRGEAEADEWTRRFQKTSRITLWVLAEEYQVVKVTYDNIGLDFLPFRWLMQVEDVTAELVMHKPFPDENVWLPRDLTFKGEVGIATGSYQMVYSLSYFDYKEAEVGARVQFRLPGVERQRD